MGVNPSTRELRVGFALSLEIFGELAQVARRAGFVSQDNTMAALSRQGQGPSLREGSYLDHTLQSNKYVPLALRSSKD